MLKKSFFYKRMIAEYGILYLVGVTFMALEKDLKLDYFYQRFFVESHKFVVFKYEVLLNYEQ